jgi:hypothetical protein
MLRTKLTDRTAGDLIFTPLPSTQATYGSERCE